MKLNLLYTSSIAGVLILSLDVSGEMTGLSDPEVFKFGAYVELSLTPVDRLDFRETDVTIV